MFQKVSILFDICSAPVLLIVASVCTYVTVCMLSIANGHLNAIPCTPKTTPLHNGFLVSECVCAHAHLNASLVI